MTTATRVTTDPTHRLSLGVPAGVTRPFRITARGHGCDTWQSHGSAGMDCAHGHVLRGGQIHAGLQRAGDRR